MNVLLIGSPSDLTHRLITTFNKENHRVSILTGSYHGVRKVEHVFEQYNFPYNSNVLSEIFESVSPDLTLFTGIYDNTFKWKDVQADSVAFVTAAMNILSSFALMKKGRLLFLSSDAVFQPRPSGFLSENDEPDANDLRGMALVEAESLCRKFRAGFGADIITVRLSGYYYTPNTPDEVEDIVSEKCLSALRYGRIQNESRGSMMLLYSADAAFFISRIALAKQPKHSLYHLSSGHVITEDELDACVNRTMESLLQADPDSQVEKSEPETAQSAAPHKQALLDNARFQNEFGINRLASMETIINEILTRMAGNRKLFLYREESLSGWKRFKKEASAFVIAAVPYLENLACFILVYFLNGILSKTAFFRQVDIYLLYVLLFAILHGQTQATFSGFLTVLSLLFSVLSDRSQSSLLLDYSTYVWIAQLFIMGMSVGYLKDRLNEQKEEALDDHEYMTNQVEDIREINGSNARVKDALETQLINQEDSVAKIYAITSSLNTFHSVDALFQGTSVICQIMGSQDVAVYVIGENSQYARLFTATSAHARQFSRSFLYQETGEMYEAFKERKVYINRFWKSEFPAMAIAVYEGESIRFIIMIWTLPLEKMTLGQANLLEVACRLMQESTMRARQYYTAIQHTQCVPNTDVLLREPFRHMVDMYDDAVEKKLTEFSVLRVMLNEEGLEATAHLLKNTLRVNDYYGLGYRTDAIYVLLPNTDAIGSERTIERLAEVGLKAFIANHELI